MDASIQSRGFGDTIAKLTGWFGVQPCSGCERRREVLNQWLPYRFARAESIIEPPRPRLVVRAQPSIQVPKGLQLGGAESAIIFASGGGWRAPDRRSGPLDLEGDRRQRRSAGPATGVSPSGSGGPATFACGIDVTDPTKAAITTTRTEFGKLTAEQKTEACAALASLRTGAFAWDIIDLHHQVTSDLLNKPYRPLCATSGATPACGSSVTVDGSCHFAGSANYVIFGVMCRLCSTHYQTMLSSASWYEVLDKDTYRQGLMQFSKSGMLGLIDLYKKYIPLFKLESPAGNLDAAKRWSIAGYDGWPTGATTPAPDRANCQLTCPHRASGLFRVSWYPFLNPYSR